jgi:hypothetical protein
MNAFPSLLRPAGAVILALTMLCGAHPLEAALTIGPWVPKFKGVDLSISTNIPPSGGELVRRQVVSALRVDLSDPDVQFFTTPRISGYQEGQREIAAYTVSDFLRNNRLQAVINANFFSEGQYYLPAGTPMDVFGLAISQGVVVSPQDTSVQDAALMFDSNNVPTVVHTNWPARPTDGVFTAVAGNYPLLVAGRNIGRKFDFEPRTVYGISEDRRYLYLVTIDGRQFGYSEGATDYESAHWLQLLGAYDGVNMDGGGSTTLVIENSTGQPQRINRSSAVADSGRERTVGSHFGIFAKPLPGFINDVVVTPKDTSATISWTTTEAATGGVRYGLTSDLGNTSASNSTPATTHSVELTGLTPETGYYYQILAVANGQEHLSPLFHFTTTNYVTTNLVFDFTNSWKYSHASLDGVNWTATNYGDSAWSEGPGLLWAHNSNPPAEVQPRGAQLPLNTATGFPYVTYYFRTHFSLAAMDPGSALLFSCYIDDGAVFYLNGTEIYRLRVPVGATSTTIANGFPCAGNADCLDEFKLPASSLPSVVAGDNVLAVEVHNYNTRSGDITFGFALNRIDPIDTGEPTEIRIAFANNAIEVNWNGDGGILQSAASVDGPWADLPTSSTKPVPIQPSEARQYYRVRK